MTAVISSQSAIIRKIDTNFLNINQVSTTTKWNPAKKHPDIYLLNGADTAKLARGKSGIKAIISNSPYVPGTTQDTVKYCIHTGGIIHVGIATATRDLYSLDPGTDLASQKFIVNNDTTLTMSISRIYISPGVYSSMLVFMYNGVKSSINITGYNGQVMYPWLSNDSDGMGFSVSLSRVTVLKSFIRENGDVVFTTIDDGGNSRPIVFETGDSPTVFDNLGFSGLPSIKFDFIESAQSAIAGFDTFDMEIRVSHPTNGLSNPGVIINENAKLTAPGGLQAPELISSINPMKLSISGGQPVTIDIAGTIITPGSVYTLSAQTNLVKPSTAGSPLELTEFTGRGIAIEDVTGNVMISNTLTVGDAGSIVNNSVIASFGDTLLNKAIVVPRINDTTINTIPISNTVIGMIAYNNATGKFVGYTSNLVWVDLN
jgi:hypothetical protein